MKIRFTTTIDDVIAFNRFHFAHSPAWRRQVWIQSLLVPGILGVLLLLVFSGLRPIPDGDLWALGVFGTFYVVISLAWIFYIRWYMNWALGRNTRKFLAEGSNRIMFGRREMELVDGRLILNTELIQSSLDLRAIEKIVSDGRYTYVYIASVSAYMIPMLFPDDEDREEEHRAFVAELREAWDHRAAPIPVEDEAAPIRPLDERIMQRRQS